MISTFQRCIETADVHRLEMLHQIKIVNEFIVNAIRLIGNQNESFLVVFRMDQQ